MSEDFGYCWRTVRLYCPAAPTFLAREWVNAAWKQLLAARRWGFMRGRVDLHETPAIPVAARLNFMRLGASRLNYVPNVQPGVPLPEQRVLPVPAALNLLRLNDTRSHLGFAGLPHTTLPARLAVMRLNTAPLAYSGPVVTNTLPVYTYTTTTDPELGRYVTLPADFASFVVVADPSRQLRLCFRYDLQELLRADPSLNRTGPPLALCATTPDPTTGLPRYRLVPGGVPTTLWAVYNRQGARLIDGVPFTGVLSDGAEVLVAGALAQAALWPGTGEKSNPYFNAGLAQAKALEFRTGVQMLSLRDDEQYRDDLWDSWEEADCGCALQSGGDVRFTDYSIYAGY